MHNIFRKISVILRFVSPYEFDIKEYRNGQIGGLAEKWPKVMRADGGSPCLGKPK